MKLLVTGGAGYIGSHTVYQLIEAGHQVVVVDNLYSGNKQNIHPEAQFYFGDFANKTLLDTVFTENKIDAVFHFAAYTDVAESIEKPQKYYENNFEKTKALVAYIISENIKYFVFSSTAAVYGIPKTNPVSENSETDPISPYGKSKLDAEKYIQSQQSEYFKAIILRYFNVAGARIDGKLNQTLHNSQKHLFKAVCETLTKKRETTPVFGNDYPTKDGTGIRDYIHVEDLASAHLNAFDYLVRTSQSNLFNCGYGNGFSVLDVITTMNKVSGQNVPYQILPKREGDSPSTFANSSKISTTTGWTPQYNDLEIICKSTLAAFL